jgi:hypothetical protein
MVDRPSRFRDDLIIQEIKSKDGSVHYVIKDPITNAFFKVGEPEYFIISNLDGKRSVADILKSFKEKFDVGLAEDEINGFIGQLQELCFLDNELTRKELLKRQKEAGREKPRTLLGRLVFLRIKALNPGRLFDRLIDHVRLFFTRKFVWAASLLILFAFIITLSNARQIADGFLGLLNLQGIIILYLSMLVVVILHEFAHGLTCKYYGGDVREIGFLLIYFQPAFYCNVSDAWLFPEKYKRLWVSFSGAFFQIFIWALAVMIWRLTQQDILINKIALAVLSFSGIATLFNFNPLLRYDGYYLLSDYVEIPNLRKKARNYWVGKLKKIFLKAGEELRELTRREKRIYFYYGILSFFYIVFILGYFFLKVEQYLVSRLGGTGFIIFAAVIIFLFRNLIVDTARGISAFFKARADFLKRRKTLSTFLMIVILIILISAFARWELRVKGELVLNPVRSLLLKYDSIGYAQLIRYDADNPNLNKQREVSIFGEYTTTTLMPLVNVGDTVAEGEIIARLVNTETSRLLQEYSANLDKEKEELSLLRQGARQEEIDKATNNYQELLARLDLSSQELQRKNEMYTKGVISRQAWEDAYTDSLVWDARANAAKNQLDILIAGARPEEIRAKEAEVAQLESRIEFYRKQQDFNEIESAINGVVLTIDTGEVACEIAGLDTLEAIMFLSEKELADIDLDQKIKFKVRSYPSLSFYGSVFRIGRKIVTDEDGDRVFRVECRVPNGAHFLKPGMTGVANIYCGKRKISYLIYRKFFRTIRTEFWDWFDWL